MAFISFSIQSKHSSFTTTSSLAMLRQLVFTSCALLFTLTSSLYSQSYSSIAHTFIEHISKYQKLQQRYASILESQYSLSSFISESSTENENQQLVYFQWMCVPLASNKYSSTSTDRGMCGKPNAVPSKLKRITEIYYRKCK